MNYWKNSLSCWRLSLRRFAQSIGLFLVVVFSFFLQVFILKLWFFIIDLLPDLIIVLWRTNFKFIPFETEQRLQLYYCYSCLDVETSCRDGGCRGMHRVSGCTLRTLYFVNSGEVASGEMLLITLLLMSLLLMTCLQEHFLQTRFFRRISSRCSKLQTKLLCSLTYSIRIFMNSTLIWILYAWTNV